MIEIKAGDTVAIKSYPGYTMTVEEVRDKLIKCIYVNTVSGGIQQILTTNDALILIDKK